MQKFDHSTALQHNEEEMKLSQKEKEASELEILTVLEKNCIIPRRKGYCCKVKEKCSNCDVKALLQHFNITRKK